MTFYNDSPSFIYTRNGDQLMTCLKESIEKIKGNNIPTQANYEKFINILQTETKKVNPRSKKVIFNKTQQLLQERKELYKEKKSKQPL